MKLIPFYKIKYRINLKSKEDLERLLYDLIKPDTQSTSFLTLPNTNKFYKGELDKKKNEFTLIRNYGLYRSDNIMKAKGSYKIKGNEIEIILTIKPYYSWLAVPFALLIVGFVFGENIYGPFILFLSSYFLICVIPINITGQRMTEDVYDKLRRHLIETVDLTTGILKF